ncbi:MAG TPA: LysE family transporter [Candidatus Limnocylindria bacterium]|nr:LysE family transporter [Candidatus Limnocylindria bacterium]
MFAAFLIGVAAGYAIAIPVGPIAILILRVGVAQGFRAAAAAGAGTATADLIYASVAMLFGAAASRFLEPFLPAARIGAAVVLAFIAIRGMFRAARVVDREIHGPMYPIFLMLTMLNPPTVLYFVSLAVALPEISTDLASRAAFVAGAFLASLSWQELLALAGAMLHGKLTPLVQRVAAVASGLIILALAAHIVLP